MPRVIAEYVRAYHEERKRLAARADAKRARLDRRLGGNLIVKSARTRTQYGRIASALRDGISEPDQAEGAQADRCKVAGL